MPSPEPTIELDVRFSSEGAKPLPWPRVLDAIEAAEIFWLSTVRSDDRPHVTPLPAMWLDGALHFCTGPDEQKAKNIEANPRCALTTGTNQFRTGLDVIVDGTAVRNVTPFPDAAQVLVPVPPDIESVLGSNPDIALAWRLATRAAVMHYLAQRYRISGFHRAQDDTLPAYELTSSSSNHA